MKSVLLHYALTCKDRPKMEGVEYDYNQSMSMIMKEGVAEPLIDYSKHMMALMTKTESAQERDDAYVEMMSLQTKTFTNMERDDQDFAYLQ